MKHRVFLPGIILILVGLLFLGRNVGWINHSLFQILFSWQMLLIVAGLCSFFYRHFIGGLALIAFGTYFLLPHLDIWWAENAQNYWPVLIVLTGIIILFKKPHKKRDKWHHKIATDMVYTSEDGYVRSEATFGSVTQIVVDPIFRGATIKNTFASTVIDLRRTSLDAAETFIDVESTFGSIEIFVPSTWVVVSKADADFGGIDDKRFHSGFVEFNNSQKAIIRGKIVFSGLEIKN
jgi:predicted membrane protein